MSDSKSALQSDSQSQSEYLVVKPTFAREILADGSILLRRLEHGVLVSATETHIFASGLERTRRYDAQMQLIEETHGYGIQILCTKGYQAGLKISEVYICNKRLVTRRSYEKARQAYPDMPIADASLHDSSAALNKLLKLERTLQRQLASSHQPDHTRAAQGDAFCQRLLAGAAVVNAYLWLERGSYILGEMSRVQTKRLLEQLQTLRCPRVYACEVEVLSSRAASSSHLVAELPTDPAQRQEVLKLASQMAFKQGFEAIMDDGQRYLYIKLD